MGTNPAMNFFAVGHFAVGQFAATKKLVSVRLGQIRLGTVKFFLTLNCTTAKNPRAAVRVPPSSSKL